MVGRRFTPVLAGELVREPICFGSLSTARYFGIEVDDALAIAEQVDI